MTSRPTDQPDRYRTPPTHTPRLRLKPKNHGAEYLDGAWWPKSADLVGELPELVAALTIRLGPVDRVVYDQRDWPTPPTQTIVAGRMVRLEPYAFHLRRTMYIIGSDATVLVLRVIPPATDDDAAHTQLMTVTAAHRTGDAETS
ncbi:DUF5994 family protein [Nocardia sp. NPDC088792]|uniref:DUF5994 family protein n=1 Tax=Nocardia sp. NPDC088792 TaxID=3364332 RepID=UPI00380A7411